jgi:hypothetical protein
MATPTVLTHRKKITHGPLYLRRSQRNAKSITLSKYGNRTAFLFLISIERPLAILGLKLSVILSDTALQCRLIF